MRLSASIAAAVVLSAGAAMAQVAPGAPPPVNPPANPPSQVQPSEMSNAPGHPSAPAVQPTAPTTPSTEPAPAPDMAAPPPPGTYGKGWSASKCATAKAKHQTVAPGNCLDAAPKL